MIGFDTGRRVARSRPRRAAGPRGSTTGRGLRRGLTLIELMVAIVILNVALLGLAGLGAAVSKQMQSGARQTRAALLVQSRLDSLASHQPCAQILNQPTGSRTTADGITEKWTIIDGNDVILIVDSVTVPGFAKPLAYRSLVPCRD